MAETFSFGLDYADWRKIVWTGVQAFLGYAVAAAADWIPGEPWNWKAFVVAGLAAAFSAVKNFALSDSSPIK